MQKKNDGLKLQVAKELGLIDKVMLDGWKSLSAKETGRIGGLMSRRKKEAMFLQASGISDGKASTTLLSNQSSFDTDS